MIIFEPDTASACTRNPISDVTFYDSTSFIFTIESPPPDGFPFAFIETAARHESKEKELLFRSLREVRDVQEGFVDGQLLDQWRQVAHPGHDLV